MTIIINNKPAMLKRGSSFEFISENRFFTDADSYTLGITFPLRGCKQNIDIFGHINRKDHDLDRLLLDCEIHDRRSASRQGDALLAKNFHSYDSISIVEISEVEVKTQFLEGRSARHIIQTLTPWNQCLQIPNTSNKQETYFRLPGVRGKDRDW